MDARAITKNRETATTRQCFGYALPVACQIAVENFTSQKKAA
jgi:hypothetical protein